MRLIDVPLAAGAVARTFTELRLAAQAPPRAETAIIVDTNLAEGEVLVTGLRLRGR